MYFNRFIRTEIVGQKNPKHIVCVHHDQCCLSDCSRATVITPESVVCLPSVKQSLVSNCQANYSQILGKLPVHHIAKHFFSFSLICYECFTFSLTWGHMGVKNSNNISSESRHQIRSHKIMHANFDLKETHQICSRRFMYTPRKSL